MEMLSLVLAVAVVVLAVACAVLCCTVPWLLWKCFHLEQKVEELDEILKDVVELAKVEKG